MNKERRAKLHSYALELETVKSKIDAALSEEEDYYDNMPENLQGSDRGIDSEEAIGVLNSISDSLDEVIDSLREV